MGARLKNQQIVLVILLAAFIFINRVTSRSQDFETFQEEYISIDAVLDSMKQQFNKVEDYTAQVRISIKMPRFRMPKKTVKLYFKQPNKVKLEADGFAVVPKTGIATSPVQIFTNLLDLHVSGQEILNDNSYWIVEGSANPDSIRISVWTDDQESRSNVTSRFWIDSEDWVIARMETYLDTAKVMSIRTLYEEFDGDIRLPKLTELKFYIMGKFFKSIEDNEILDPDAGVSLEDVDFRGFVRLEFSKYRINRGLSDKIFKDTTF